MISDAPAPQPEPEAPTDWKTKAELSEVEHQAVSKLLKDVRAKLQQKEADCEGLAQKLQDEQGQGQRTRLALDNARAALAREVAAGEKAEVTVMNEHRVALAREAAAREKAEASLVNDHRVALTREVSAREKAEASFIDQQGLAERLQIEVKTLSAKICRLLEEKATFPAAPEQDNPSSPRAMVQNLSDFLADSEPADSTAPAGSPAEADTDVEISETASVVESFQVEGAESEAGASSSNRKLHRPRWRSMFSKAFTNKSSRSDLEDEDFQKLLASLAVIPPTRHVVRGPAGVAVDRLRVAAASSGEISGVPAAERGALWAASVGNNLRLTSEEFTRVCRRRDRFRWELQSGIDLRPAPSMPSNPAAAPNLDANHVNEDAAQGLLCNFPVREDGAEAKATVPAADCEVPRAHSDEAKVSPGSAEDVLAEDAKVAALAAEEANGAFPAAGDTSADEAKASASAADEAEALSVGAKGEPAEGVKAAASAVKDAATPSESKAVTAENGSMVAPENAPPQAAQAKSISAAEESLPAREDAAAAADAVHEIPGANASRSAPVAAEDSPAGEDDMQGLASEQRRVDFLAEAEELELIRAHFQQISLDLNRTFHARDLAPFKIQGNRPLQEPLRDVLEAFAILKPEYGYTQGMSFIAALMILHMDVFPAYVCFTNAVLLQPWLAACYAFDMVLIRRYFEVFDGVLLACLPKVAKHFQAVGLQSEVILIEWWFTLFARSLPLPIVVRLWDVFFLEGDFLLYRASLAIIQYFSEALLSRARDECLALLASWPSQHLDPTVFFETFGKVTLTEKKLAAAFTKVAEQPDVKSR